MKYLSLIISLCFTCALSAQETTTISKLNDSTFVETTTQLDDQGRILSQTNKYSTLAEFANLLVNSNVSNAISADNLEKSAQGARRDIDRAKKYVLDSLGVNYDSLLNAKLLVALTGDWKFIEIQNGVRTVNGVTISPHPTSPILLRAKEKGGRAWSIKAIHTQRWQLRLYKVAGVNETVEMSFANSAYRGKASDRTVIVLRR